MHQMLMFGVRWCVCMSPITISFSGSPSPPITCLLQVLLFFLGKGPSKSGLVELAALHTLATIAAIAQPLFITAALLSPAPNCPHRQLIVAPEGRPLWKECWKRRTKDLAIFCTTSSWQ